MGDFALAIQRAGGAAPVVRVVGELDAYTAPRLAETVDALRQEGAASLVIDLEGVRFLDSTGLAVLVRSLRDLNDAGGELTLRNPPPRVTRVLEISGAARLFATP